MSEITQMNLRQHGIPPLPLWKFSILPALTYMMYIFMLYS